MADKKAYRKIITEDEGYSKIIATIRLPEFYGDMNIDDGTGALYNYVGCQRDKDDDLDFDFECGIGYKPAENKMWYNYGLYYSLVRPNHTKQWKWLKYKSGSNEGEYVALEEGTKYQLKLYCYDGEIRAKVYNEDDDHDLEYSATWEFEGPRKSGTNQKVRRVTSLLIPTTASKTYYANNNSWTTTSIGDTADDDDELENTVPSNCDYDQTDGVTVDWDNKYYDEIISLEIED